ncbi:MAG: hypothetical protein RLZZ230_835 [Candidatus Parcubacteria bacterium]|jgi:hypothetical protein
MKTFRHLVVFFLLFFITDLAIADEECKSYASYDNKKICLSSTKDVILPIESRESFAEETWQAPLPIYVDSDNEPEEVELLIDPNELIENN